MSASIVPESVIRHYKESRSLVSVTREDIDSDQMQGFVLDYNSTWILFGKIYDLTYDGLFICRIADLTSMNCRATDAFQRGMMEDEGVLSRIDFSQSFDSLDLEDYINSIPKNKVVIVEDEKDDIFLIGTNVKFEKGEEDLDLISLDFFSGAGRYDEERSDLYLESISSISLDTVYSLFYERYFSRNK